jgi:peptidoglycan/xylan/chitin deacetylase (PgdA/CDA1 family)
MKRKRYIAIGIFIILVISPLIYRAYLRESTKMVDLSEYTIEEARNFTEENNLKLEINKMYSNEEKDKIIYQSIREGSTIDKGQELLIKISLGHLSLTQLKENEVNELGEIPVMMYHGIENLKNSETGYTGGNVDINGYNRTTEAFEQDLDFFYQNGYRMIKLENYINGEINTALGKSPLVITFDDGKQDNFNVLGLNEDEELIIDPNSAIGILENFKDKYPDYNVTATFFLNSSLFYQPEYNDQILVWLIDNGYSIGNHSFSHIDLEQTTIVQTKEEINKMYNLLNTIVPENYTNIVSLPYGKPSTKEHQNLQYILDTGTYKTKATLRVGWSPDESPFSINFDPEYIQRCRAWDNNGKIFDIEMNFKNLTNTKYISDGNSRTIVYPKELEDTVNNINQLQEIKY